MLANLLACRPAGFQTGSDRGRCIGPLQGDPTHHSTWLSRRPRSFEKAAVDMILDVLRQDSATPAKPGFKYHVVHLSNADLLPALKAAKDEGAHLFATAFAASCPH